MTIHKTEALVLGSIKLTGADKIVCVYSPEYGQIRGVAHGIKRIKNPFGSALEPLNHISLIVKLRSTRELQLYMQADIINSYNNIRNDIIILSTGLYLAELIQRLTPLGGDGQPAVFELILKALELICRKYDIFSIMRIFEIRLLDLLGYRPYLDKCIDCSTTSFSKGWGFSPSMGGVLCPLCISKCTDLLSISPGSIMFLKKALDINLDMIGRLRVTPYIKKETERLLQTTLSQYLTSPFKSYPILLRLLGDKNV